MSVLLRAYIVRRVHDLHREGKSAFEICQQLEAIASPRGFDKVREIVREELGI